VNLEAASVNVTGFLAWIREKTRDQDPWLFYARRLTKAYEGRVADSEDFAYAVLVEAAVTYKAEYSQSYDDPAKYIFGIARNICGRFAAEPNSPLPGNLAAPTGLPLPSRGRLQLTVALERCLQSLPAKDHQLIYRYYVNPGPEAREDTAQRHGMSIKTLRVNVHRICRRLRDCTEQTTSKKTVPLQQKSQSDA
jgi:DNA-directed RNA polymerase specialized sigma24 family protein